MSDNLATALAKVQGALHAVRKDKKADAGKYGYTYADLAAVQEAAFPLLSANGLAWSASPTLTDQGFALRYSLMHGESGDELVGLYPLPDPSRGTAQQIGSAVTYARRYCLSAVVGIATEDDDGKAASEASAPKARKTTDRLPAPQRNSAEEAEAHERELRNGPRADRSGPVPPNLDPWADVEVTRPPVVTDPAWITDVTQRVAGCGSLPELRGLRAEVVAQAKDGKAAEADAGDLLTLIDEHGADLKAKQEAAQLAEASK